MVQRRKQIENLLEDILVLKRKIFFGPVSNLENGHITASQWPVLRFLKNNDGSTLKGIAQALTMTSSAATQLVEPLVQRGYIIRKTSTSDKRALKLGLSAKGKRHMATLRTRRIADMANVFGVFTDEEFETYRLLLGKIAKSLTAEEQ